MNTLLINLTRFGDLLQTQPAISGLTQQGHNVGLVCLENFAGATALLRNVEQVIPLKGARLLSQLDSCWPEAIAELWKWQQQIEHRFPPAHTINVTATLSGRLLARMLTPDHYSLQGFGLDSFGFGENSDPWTTFLQASTRRRGCSPFNLVDLYWMAAGLPRQGSRTFALQQPSPENTTAIHNSLQTKAPEKGKGFVAFQLGASESRRQWPATHFAKLGNMLWQKHQLVPVLLGTNDELPLQKEYDASCNAPRISLIGKTSLQELAAALQQVKLLVSNDTGTMHLAAGLGTPILGIFLATAQPWDTGPYLENSCSLEPNVDCHPCPFGTPCPNGHACLQKISADTLFSLISHKLQAGHWPTLKQEEARIWEAIADPEGFMNLRSLSFHESTDRTLWIRQQRHYYGQFLDRPVVLPPSEATSPKDITVPLPMPWENSSPSPHMQATVAGELAQSAQLLHLLMEQGNVLLQRPVEPIKKSFLTTCQRLQTLWDNSIYLNVLGFLWMSESQQAGQNLTSVLTLARNYHTLVHAWHTHFTQ